MRRYSDYSDLDKPLDGRTYPWDILFSLSLRSAKYSTIIAHGACGWLTCRMYGQRQPIRHLKRRNRAFVVFPSRINSHMEDFADTAHNPSKRIAVRRFKRLPPQPRVAYTHMASSVTTWPFSNAQCIISSKTKGTQPK